MESWEEGFEAFKDSTCVKWADHERRTHLPKASRWNFKYQPYAFLQTNRINVNCENRWCRNPDHMRNLEINGTTA